AAASSTATPPVTVRTGTKLTFTPAIFITACPPHGTGHCCPSPPPSEIPHGRLRPICTREPTYARRTHLGGRPGGPTPRDEHTRERLPAGQPTRPGDPSPQARTSDLADVIVRPWGFAIGCGASVSTGDRGC